MTTMQIDRAVVEQALEVLDEADTFHRNLPDQRARRLAAMTALRAALAQQDEPVATVAENATTQQFVGETPPSDYRRGYWDGFNIGKREGRIEAEDALAQQAEPVEPVEPVAWSGYDLDGMVEAFSRVIEAHHSSKHPFHNPIDMDAKMALRILRGFIPAMKAYAATPQRLPLTAGEIEHIGMTHQSLRQVVRAVEQAHGIKE